MKQIELILFYFYLRKNLVVIIANTKRLKISARHYIEAKGFQIFQVQESSSEYK